MNWQEAIEEITGPAFSADLSVVSGTNAFFRAMKQQPAVREAQRLLLESGEAREEALGYIYSLAAMETDPDFLNPNDKPLAALLWMTTLADYHAENAARWVDQAVGCWYAKELAQWILNPPPAPSRTAECTFWSNRPETQATDAENVNFMMQPTTKRTHLGYRAVHPRKRATASAIQPVELQTEPHSEPQRFEIPTFRPSEAIS